MSDLFQHHHHHAHDDSGPVVAKDPGSRSLADALRVSFRLLSAIMLVVLLFYMLTGVKSIESSQVGIKKVFGKVVGLAEPGLAYTWPFPIGNIEVVSSREQELSIEDFWMYETPEQKGQDLLSRGVMDIGLDPALNGSLLTGDRSLLHVRLSCKYRITRPLDFVSNIAGADEQRARDVVRSAVCRSAIRAAATHTADALMRTTAAFALEVREGTQQELDSLGSGIEVVSVSLPSSTWPLGALRAYLDAQSAISKAEQARSTARAYAEKKLNEAAGASYRKLVGDMGLSSSSGQQTVEQGDYDLIGQYAAAVATKDTAAATSLLTRIDDVLRSGQTGGTAAKVISEAEAYRTRTIQQIKSRAQRFAELLPAFRKTPEVLLLNLWAEVRDEILNAPTVEKYYLTLGSDKTVIKINRDPKVAAQITEAEVKAQTDAKRAASGE